MELNSSTEGARLPADGTVYAFDVARMAQGAEALPSPQALPPLELPSATLWPLPPPSPSYPLPSMVQAHECLRDSGDATATELLPPVLAAVAQTLRAADDVRRSADAATAVLARADRVALASNAALINLRALRSSAQNEVAGLQSAIQSLAAPAQSLRARYPVYIERLHHTLLHPALVDAVPGVAAPRLDDVVDLEATAQAAERGWVVGTSVQDAAGTLSTELETQATNIQAVASQPVVPAATVQSVKSLLATLKAARGAAAAAADEATRDWEEVAAPLVAALDVDSAAAEAAEDTESVAALEAAERVRLSVVSKHLPAVGEQLAAVAGAHAGACECLRAVQTQQLMLLGKIGAAQAALSGVFAQCRAIRAQLAAWRQGLQSVANVRYLPSAYSAAVHEVARRRAYGRLLHARVQSMVAALEGSTSREAGRRRRFAQRHGFLLPDGLIPGLNAPPPRVELSAELMDGDLPEIDNVPSALSGTAESGASSAAYPSPLLGPLAEPGAPATGVGGSTSTSSSGSDTRPASGPPSIAETRPGSSARGGDPVGQTPPGAPAAPSGKPALTALTLAPAAVPGPAAQRSTSDVLSPVLRSVSDDAAASPHSVPVSVSPLLRAFNSAVASNAGIAGSSGGAGAAAPPANAGMSASVLSTHQSLLLRLREVEAENATLRAKIASMQATQVMTGRVPGSGTAPAGSPLSDESAAPAPSIDASLQDSLLLGGGGVDGGTTPRARSPAPADAALGAVRDAVQQALVSASGPGLLAAFSENVETALGEQDREDVARVRHALHEAMALDAGDSVALAGESRAPKSPAVEAVWSTTSQLCRLLSYAVGAVRSQRLAAAHSVVYSGFMPGRQAMFLRVPWPLRPDAPEAPGPAGAFWQYVAFNVNAPHHYVDGGCLPPQVLSLLPDFIILAVESVNAYSASAAFNPYGVQPGTQFFAVSGAVVATGAPLSAAGTPPVPAYAAPAPAPAPMLAPPVGDARSGMLRQTSWGEAQAPAAAGAGSPLP